MEPGDDVHTLVGAYVMDAVPAPDRVRFEEHLAGCSACREEISELREATASLAVAAAVVPRAELKARAMRAAEQTRQLPPLTVASEVSETPGAAAAPAPATGGAGRRPRWRLAPRITAAAAAALVALVVVLAVLTHGARHQLDQDQRRELAISAVLTAPDAVMLTSHVGTGGSATVVMSHTKRMLVFTASGLRALPAAQRYELWLMGPGADRPAGLFSAPRGVAKAMVVSGLTAGDWIGLTIEPAAGTPTPTSPLVLVLKLGR
jgi:anti-sigma factor RsiW